MGKRTTSRAPAARRSKNGGDQPGDGPASAGGERTRRLVNLTALLLDTREGLTFDDIRAALPGAYDGAHDAAIRKFERDKEDLLELGLPLDHPMEDGEQDASRYQIDRRAAFLPEIHFTAEEASVLLLAGSALLAQDEFPYRRHLEMAIAKLRLGDEGASGAGSDGVQRDVIIHHGLVAGGADTRRALNLLGAAVAARKHVTFTYRAQTTGAVEKRSVDPYGLTCRRGAWFLVGHASERDAIRTFFVHRMSRIVRNPSRPKSADFEVPSTFDMRDYVDRPRWRWQLHEPMDVAIQVDPALAPLAARELGLPAPTLPRAAGAAWPTFTVSVTNVDGIIEWVLGLGPRARIVGPPDTRARIRLVLERTLARNEARSAPAARPRTPRPDPPSGGGA